MGKIEFYGFEVKCNETEDNLGDDEVYLTFTLLQRKKDPETGDFLPSNKIAGPILSELKEMNNNDLERFKFLSSLKFQNIGFLYNNTDWKENGEPELLVRVNVYDSDNTEYYEKAKLVYEKFFDTTSESCLFKEYWEKWFKYISKGAYWQWKRAIRNSFGKGVLGLLNGAAAAVLFTLFGSIIYLLIFFGGLIGLPVSNIFCFLLYGLNSASSWLFRKLSGLLDDDDYLGGETATIQLNHETTPDKGTLKAKADLDDADYDVTYYYKKSYW